MWDISSHYLFIVMEPVLEIGLLKGGRFDANRCGNTTLHHLLKCNIHIIHEKYIPLQIRGAHTHTHTHIWIGWKIVYYMICEIEARNMCAAPLAGMPQRPLFAIWNTGNNFIIFHKVNNTYPHTLHNTHTLRYRQILRDSHTPIHNTPW